MPSFREVKPGHVLMGRLTHGADLLEEITGICAKENIRLGAIEAIGSVQKANIGYYDQATHQYHFTVIDEALEITSLTGNISIKDGAPMVHAHVTLAGRGGTVRGGHLGKGTIVFAGEFVIREFRGADLVRSLDEQTGLPLWDMRDS